jgi:hypothetical protein
MAAELGVDGGVEDIGFFISSSDHPFQGKLSHIISFSSQNFFLPWTKTLELVVGGWLNLYCSSGGFMDFCMYEAVVI